MLTGADLTTVMREIPFSAIQFPLYEGAKRRWAEWQGRPVNTLQASLCGSVRGGFAAAVTTPLDVTKTRLMLGADSKGVPYKVSKHPLTPHQPPACSCDLGEVSDASHNVSPFSLLGYDFDNEPSRNRRRSGDTVLRSGAPGVLDLYRRRSLFGRL